MARKKRDYYVILGVNRDATEADVKRAFRDLARKHHPDMAPADGGERFREINEAYAVLSDKESRARYDRWGHPDDGSSGLSAVVDAAQEIINDVFRRAGRRGKQRGKDVRYTLEIAFEEAAFGATKTIQIPPPPGKPGSEGKARELTVVVPAGTSSGTVKTIRGEGEPGTHGGATGDLHVTVRVAEHATFRREGHDVRSDHALTFAQAALGAVVDIATLEGPVKMRIPEGTQPGRIFRIRGRGIPQSGGKNAPRGDHLVTVSIDVPTELTPRQRELIEELARTLGDPSTPDSSPQRPRRLLDRVRSLLDE
ncbi:MAG: J domain-containing protein [Deltaproteobacteria bacterium]|nr:J domain-containing protein [Deltaproteobacteria bacterium]MCW5808409.1 J domain-containing protein [Deltaproteobacteria bacterium]